MKNKLFAKSWDIEPDLSYSREEFFNFQEYLTLPNEEISKRFNAFIKDWQQRTTGLTREKVSGLNDKYLLTTASEKGKEKKMLVWLEEIPENELWNSAFISWI